MFAEGALDYGGELTGNPTSVLKMLPVWWSMGDCDAIVGFRSLCHKSRFALCPNLNACDFRDTLSDGSEEKPAKPVEVKVLTTL